MSVHPYHSEPTFKKQKHPIWTNSSVLDCQNACPLPPAETSKKSIFCLFWALFQRRFFGEKWAPGDLCISVEHRGDQSYHPCKSSALWPPIVTIQFKPGQLKKKFPLKGGPKSIFRPPKNGQKRAIFDHVCMPSAPIL
jgi:hypothetical protein